MKHYFKVWKCYCWQIHREILYQTWGFSVETNSKMNDLAYLYSECPLFNQHFLCLLYQTLMGLPIWNRKVSLYSRVNHYISMIFSLIKELASCSCLLINHLMSFNSTFLTMISLIQLTFIHFYNAVLKQD